MRAGIVEPEAYRHGVDEIPRPGIAARGKIVADAENKLIFPGDHLTPGQQGSIRSPIRIGARGNQVLARRAVNAA